MTTQGIDLAPPSIDMIEGISTTGAAPGMVLVFDSNLDLVPGIGGGGGGGDHLPVSVTNQASNPVQFAIGATNQVLSGSFLASNVNHDDLANPNGNSNEQHLTAAQVSALHDAVTISNDTNSALTLGLSGQQISVSIDATKIDHDSLANPNGNSNEQHLTAAQVAALHPAITVTDTSTINLTLGSNQSLSADYIFPGQQIVVAKSAGQFSTIQAAIDSVTNASASNPYVIRIYPGVYTENVVIKDFVSLENGLAGTTTIEGRVSGSISSNATAGIRGFSLDFIPTADGQIGIDLTGGTMYIIDISMTITGAADYAITGMKLTSLVSLTLRSSTVFDRRSGNITKNFTGIDLFGAGTTGALSTSVSARGAYTAGTSCLWQISGTGPVTQNSCVAIFSSTAAFSGEARGVCCETASTATRLVQGTQINLLGISGGTATGFHLNSSSNAATMTYSGCLLSINGFTTENLCDTAVGDTQKIFSLSCNKTLMKAGLGLAVVTPFDETHTGFIQWSSVGTNYFSYNTGTRVFTLNKRLAGEVKSAPVIAPSAQTVTLTNFADNYIYVTSEGVLTRSATGTGLYSDNIVLFELYSDGTNYICKKENHPVSVNEGISTEFHKLIGTLLENNGGGNITLLSGVGRTIKMVGDTVAHDHGLTTTVPDSAGAALSFTSLYTGASGMVIDGTGITAIPSKWQNTATTVANAANNDRIVVRVGLIMDNLNSSSPQYVYSYHNAVYANNSAAASAIATDIAGTATIAAFPSGTTALEILQLGYATIQADGAGGGTLVAVTIAKQVATASKASGGASSAGNTITDISLFDKILSSNETNVQLALNKIDEIPATIRTWTAKQTFDGGAVIKGATSAIGTGYVGEQLVASGNVVQSVSDTLTNTHSVSLTAGIWLVKVAATPTPNPSYAESSYASTFITVGATVGSTIGLDWGIFGTLLADRIGNTTLIQKLVVLGSTTTVKIQSKGRFSAGAITWYESIEAIRIA